MPLRIKKLTPAIGAQIDGMDLNAPFDCAQINLLHQLLIEHQVIFFRNQAISPQSQRDLASLFGTLHVHPVFPKYPDVPEVLILDNWVTNLADNALWHTDVTFIAKPPLGCVLCAKVVPTVGGDTLWASNRSIWLSLPNEMKSFLRGKTATHDFRQSFPREHVGNNPEAIAQWERAVSQNPPISHPVVRIHPQTGEESIFVSEGFTVSIDGIEKSLSDEILTTIFKATYRPENNVRWKWSVNDVAIWDNRNTQHYAINDYKTEHRVMNRATINGDKPIMG